MFKFSLKNRLLLMMMFAVLVALLFALTSYGQTIAYPDKPIEILVTYGPEGMNDIAARGIQSAMSDVLGVPVNIRNIPGSGGRLGREFVYKAKPEDLPYCRQVHLQL